MSVVDHARAVPSPAWDVFTRQARPAERSVANASQYSHIGRLPDTVLSLIVSKLHIREQVGVAELVSTTWRRASRLLPQNNLDFHSGSSDSQVLVYIGMVSRLVARAVWITNSSQPRLDGSTINPVTSISLTGCSSKPGQSAAQLIAYCIQLCPNLQELVACKVGDGRSKPAMPLSADGALQVLRACNRHTKIKRVRIDVDAYSLADTWETTSYQRAIGVEPLWQTFLLLLEGSSRVCINRLAFNGYRTSGHARSSVAPSEFRKVTASKAKDLADVIDKNTTVCGLLILDVHLAPAALDALSTSAQASNSIGVIHMGS